MKCDDRKVSCAVDNAIAVGAESGWAVTDAIFMKCIPEGRERRSKRWRRRVTMTISLHVHSPLMPAD
jgi:hypothetical protein